MTTPLSTAMPQRAMNPMAAGRLKVSPRSLSATMPPMSAKGTPEKTASA
jgi:hypothetical protein